MLKPSFSPSGLSQGKAGELIENLQDRLVALVDLSLVLKHIHWNVVGAGFLSVHEMLDDHVIGIRQMSDAVAERIATLGGVPNGLIGHMTKSRDWDDYSVGRAVVPAHLAALDLVYDGVIGDHREAISYAADRDPVTEDLLVGQAGKLELYQWFVRAHIENTSGELMHGGAESELEAASTAATADPLK